MLSFLAISHIRRIAEARVTPAPGINLVHGPNGSGKTSLLEAVHLLSTAKSFRTHRTTDVISHGQLALAVAGKIAASDGTSIAVHKIGVEKSAKDTRLRLDGENVRSASVLASLFPVLVLDTEAYSILDGGPANRRALLDRTLFHVEQNYLATFKSYHRALKQRNELLRSPRAARSDAEYWDVELSRSGHVLDALRAECVERLNERLLSDILRTRVGAVSFQYHRGWKAGDKLHDVLASHWARDRDAGTTTSGSHRADLRLLVNGRSGPASLSRGQGKLVMAALTAAQAHLIQDGVGKRPVLLVDDLAAELDAEGRMLATSLLLERSAQVFFTATDPALLRTPLAGHAVAMFHVEHGAIVAEASLIGLN